MAATNFSSKVIDPSSLANLSEVLTQHVHFNWTISFTEKKIYGHVLLDLITLAPNVSKVVLDTSYLDLKDVSLNGQSLKVMMANYGRGERKGGILTRFVFLVSILLLNVI